MKTHTSKSRIWIRSLLVLPLLAVLIFGFSSREEIERNMYTLNEVTVQKGATKDQIKEYNILAKKYNAMSKDNMRVNAKDVSRIKYLYDLMTSKQQQNAEPFPNFPPPPPPPAPINENAPKAPAAPKVVKGVIDINSEIPPPPPVAPKLEEVKLRKVKELEKTNKTLEKVALRSIKELEVRNKELELKRIALIDKRKYENSKLRKIEQEKKN